MITLTRPGILFLIFLFTQKIQAQDLQLTFEGSGASNSVDSVIVENLTQGNHLSMNGGDILHLKNMATGIPGFNQVHSGTLLIYPNPTRDFSSLKFESSAPGNTIVEVSDLSGRVITQIRQNLPAGKHTFQIDGLGSGIYLVRVTSNGSFLCGRLLSINSELPDITLKYTGSESIVYSRGSLKNAGSEVLMQYNTGDLLKITCISGNFSTVIMETPTESTVVQSYFMACSDQDNNDYPVVQIGNQTWMAENLKTTRYANGNPINYISDSAAWHEATGGSYCFYTDSVQFKNSLGALYNWQAVNDSNKLCPAGWHVPTDAEWTILQTALGGNADAGGKLKETGTGFWNGGNPNSDNESGFTGRPGGHRSDLGSFAGIGDLGVWWSSTGGTADSSWTFDVTYNTTRLDRNLVKKSAGSSVRCISGTPGLPVVTTGSIYPVELLTAISGGTVTSDGGASVIARGVCWSSDQNPTISNNHTIDSLGSGSFISRLTGLTPGATYFIRAYATNAIGTAYGADSSFITLSAPTTPIISTARVSVINSTSASGGGNVISNGGDEILARGICWSFFAHPTVELGTKTADGKGIGKFTSQMTGLTENTTYYIRAYATNNMGTSYGTETTFSIVMNLAGPTVTDVDGNVYETVNIGNQLWMAENLKTMHFRDGTAVPSSTLTPSAWLSLTSSALCYYDNDELHNKNIYGALYNWYAVADDRNLCPAGWHVPSNEDWLDLREYLGGEVAAGGKMKDIESGLWSYPNTGADNSSGFTALPGGDRDDGNFGSIHDGGGWWSSTAVNEEDAWSHYLYYSQTNFFPSPDEKVSGCSVRCLKD